MCVKEQFVLNLLDIVFKEKERTMTLGYVTLRHLESRNQKRFDWKKIPVD